MCNARQNDQDISAYTVEMTLDMQNRIRMLKHITAGGLSETRAKETDGQGSKNGQGLKNVSLRYCRYMYFVRDRAVISNTSPLRWLST